MNKVEEVARAIFEADIASTQKDFPNTPENILRVAGEALFQEHHMAMARAAIEAMREPTEAIVDAFGAAFYTDWHQISADETYRDQARKGIAAANSAALSENQ